MQPYKITTDETFRETIQHGNPAFRLAYYVDDIWKYDFHYVDWHWHYELEIATAWKGTIRCLVGTDTILLSEGESILINSGIMHRFETDDGAVMPNLVFDPRFLVPEDHLVYEKYVRPFLQSSLSFWKFGKEESWEQEESEILKEIYRQQEQQEQKESTEIVTLRLLLQFWETFVQCVPIQNYVLQDKNSTAKQYKIQAMLQFIHDHYKEDITLSKIASSAAIGKSSALQIFKQEIHVSPIEYLIQYRLSQAAFQLRTTEKAVAAIAADCGFSDASYFCRRFKECYQMRPNEYRKNNT